MTTEELLLDWWPCGGKWCHFLYGPVDTPDPTSFWGKGQPDNCDHPLADESRLIYARSGKLWYLGEELQKFGFDIEFWADSDFSDVLEVIVLLNPAVRHDCERFVGDLARLQRCLDHMQYGRLKPADAVAAEARGELAHDGHWSGSDRSE